MPHSTCDGSYCDSSHSLDLCPSLHALEHPLQLTLQLSLFENNTQMYRQIHTLLFTLLFLASRYIIIICTVVSGLQIHASIFAPLFLTSRYIHQYLHCCFCSPDTCINMYTVVSGLQGLSLTHPAALLGDLRLQCQPAAQTSGHWPPSHACPAAACTR